MFSSIIIREEEDLNNKLKIMVLTTPLNSSRDLHLVTRTHLRTWVWISIHQVWALPLLANLVCQFNMLVMEVRLRILNIIMEVSDQLDPEASLVLTKILISMD